MAAGTKQKSLFEEYDPLKDKMFQVMDDNGKIVNPKWMPEIDDEKVLEIFKFMHFARTADLMAVSYQRQGRMYTYPPNLGQEAISAAIGFSSRPEDWAAGAFREMGLWMLKGATLKEIFMYWGGYEEGTKFADAPHLLPVNVPIASQLVHAAGVGYALKYKKKKGVVFGIVGDGGTSQGDFHEGINFAAVWKAPVVYVIQNNQYAISVPISAQTMSKNLAVKSIAYGIPGIKVDGNDYFAMARTIHEAIKHAESGKGPVLIEAVTFRQGAHTTSDDPSLYRTTDEEKSWEVKDPLLRLQKYLESKKLWKEADNEKLLEEYRKEVDAQFKAYEEHTPYEVDDVFDYHYKDMPEDLLKQKIEYQKFLNWEKTQ
jgi:pyruvate dehydrogenase E1 component alpha subunit